MEGWARSGLGCPGSVNISSSPGDTNSERFSSAVRFPDFLALKDKRSSIKAEDLKVLNLNHMKMCAWHDSRYIILDRNYKLLGGISTPKIEKSTEYYTHRYSSKHNCFFSCGGGGAVEGE